MKEMLKIVFAVWIAAMFGSCDDAKVPTFVYGTVSVYPGDSASFHGDMSESEDLDYFGSCKMSNGTFEFTVGHASWLDIGKYVSGDGVRPVVIKATAILGPPEVGVYNLPTLPPEPRTSANPAARYTKIRVMNQEGDWTLTPANSDCLIDLFAVPGDGELIFDNNLNKSFDYYVRFHCTDYTGVASLYSLDAEFFFENCS